MKTPLCRRVIGSNLALCRLCSWRAWEIGFGGLSWGGLACCYPSSSQISSKGLFLFGNFSLLTTGVQFELLIIDATWKTWHWGISGAPPRQSWRKTKLMYFVKRVLATWHTPWLFCALLCITLLSKGEGVTQLLGYSSILLSFLWLCQGLTV